jgi:arylsulfatase A-like enzyme
VAVIDGYDCGIGYMDTRIGQVLEALREQGIDEEGLKKRIYHE